MSDDSLTPCPPLPFPLQRRTPATQTSRPIFTDTSDTDVDRWDPPTREMFASEDLPSALRRGRASFIAGPPPAASTSREGAWRARAEDATATPPTPPSTATRTTPRTTLTSWTISRSTAGAPRGRVRTQEPRPALRAATARSGTGRRARRNVRATFSAPDPRDHRILPQSRHRIAARAVTVTEDARPRRRDASAPPATPRRRLPPPRASRPDPATATNDATPRLPRDVPTTRRRRPRGYGRAVSNGTRMSWRSWRWTMTTVEARERIPVEARIERARARTRFRRVRRRCLRPSRRVWTRRRPRVDVIDRACPASTVRSRRGSGRISLHLREERRESETRRRRLQKVSRPTPPPSRRVEESLERDETRPGKSSSGDDDRRRERERAPRRTARERVRRRVRDCFRDRVRVIEGFVSRRRSSIIRR